MRHWRTSTGNAPKTLNRIHEKQTAMVGAELAQLFKVETIAAQELYEAFVHHPRAIEKALATASRLKAALGLLDQERETGRLSFLDASRDKS